MRTPRCNREFASVLRAREFFRRAPFGVDFAEDVLAEYHHGHKRTALLRVPWWLALMELQQAGYTYGRLDETELPYRLSQVVDILALTRAERAASATEHCLGASDDLARALTANPVFRCEIAAHDLFLYGVRDKEAKFFNSKATQREGRARLREESLLEQALADEIASEFFEFVTQQDLR